MPVGYCVLRELRLLQEHDVGTQLAQPFAQFMQHQAGGD
jgi:hypothetical protein